MGLGSAGPQGSTANGTQAEERANGSLRVLAVGTLYPPRSLGDYERVWKDAVVKLRDGGHQVKVLCSDWAGNDTGEDEDPDIRRDLRLYVDDVLDVRSEERAELVAREVHNRQIVDEVLAEFRPDVALLGPVFGLPLSVVTRIQEAGVAQVAFVADDWPKDAPKADPGQQLLGWTARLFGRPAREGVEGRRFRYADVDQWVCASERAADVVRRAGADPHTLTVLRPGPDPRRFRRRDAKPLRGELLYAGLLHPKKGVEHAVRALAAAEKFKLTIAGPGDPRHVEKLREIAAEEGVQDRVRMLGEQYKRMPELYAESDAVLFPSVWREAWTLGPLEAMAVGRPVITTAVGGMAEYLRHEENALVVRPADPGAIAAAVDRLAKDDVLHARLIQGGFATADEYRYDRFLDRLAGTVVALGESPGERDEEESVTEPQQHEPVPQPEPEETPDRQPAQETPVGAPEAVGTIATPRRRFAGVQGQAIGGRPEPAATATEAPPKEEATKVEPEPVAEAPAPEQTAEPPKPEPTATQPAPAPPQPEPVVEEAMPEPEQPTPPAPEPQPVAAPPKPEPVAEQPKPEPVAAPPKPEAPAPAPAAETPAETPAAPAPIPEVAADDENVPEAEEWLPAGYEAVERIEPVETPPSPSETTEWAAISAEQEAERAPADDAAPAPSPDTAPVPDESALGLISRLAALEARVAELSTSAVGGIERNASELATLEGRVGELATSSVAGVERNSAELKAIEKRVGELANSAVAGVERTNTELAALEKRVTEIAESAVSGVERNAAQLATIDTRLSELAATASTAREHQGTELGSLQTRVGELAAFAELRGEALGQRIDELERTVQAAEEARSRSLDDLTTRLEAIEQRIGNMPLADLPIRLERVEALANEVWRREEALAEQQRAATARLAKLKGIDKLNEASFEQLRGLGLSGTQAARLLAAREARSGFDSVDDLAAIPGFPQTLIAELKQLVDS